MDFAPAIAELEKHWFPNTPDSALSRVISLLESGSPLLINRAFERCSAMGCLATQIAWHHPTTNEYPEAGVYWLGKIVGLNPGTSLVIRAWDDHGITNWTLRMELLAAFRNEQKRREEVANTTILHNELEVAQVEQSIQSAI